MLEEQMGSEFGSVIIDDVWQCQACSDGFPQAASAPTFHGNYEQTEVTFLFSKLYFVLRNNVAQGCSIINLNKACFSASL